jgi:hypothetical protein
MQYVVVPALCILPFDLDTTLHWGREDRRRHWGHGLTVATGNGRDFKRLGVPWVDPGQGSAVTGRRPVAQAAPMAATLKAIAASGASVNGI